MGRAGGTKSKKTADAVEGKERATGQEASAEGGVVSGSWVPEMRQAIRAELKKPECKKIAAALIQGAADGKVAAFRTLLLMENLGPDAEAAQEEGYSQASVWMNEAEWAEGEAAAGGVEAAM